MSVSRKSRTEVVANKIGGEEEEEEEESASE